VVDRKRIGREVIRKVIKDNIRAARLAATLTQAALADMLGVTQKDISRWETGVREPSATWIKKLAEALGVSADELLK
jgi:transcriptional regulator with XRE-family HTH domain